MTSRVLVCAGLLVRLLVVEEVRAAAGNITSVWANDGGDKVTRDELRAKQEPPSVRNSVWDGSRVELFGARNEVVAFNLILEAASAGADDVTVSFKELRGPEGISMTSTPVSGDGVFR